MNRVDIDADGDADALVLTNGKSYPPSPSESGEKATEAAVLLFPETDLTTAGQPFDKTLELFGITFRVFSANTGATNTVTITPAAHRRSTFMYQPRMMKSAVLSLPTARIERSR